VVWPSRGEGSVERTVERLLEKTDSRTIPVRLRAPGVFKRGLNESGWLAEEVIAAGELRQARGPSLLGRVTGLALIDMVRSRRCLVSNPAAAARVRCPEGLFTAGESAVNSRQHATTRRIDMRNLRYLAGAGMMAAVAFGGPAGQAAAQVPVPLHLHCFTTPGGTHAIAQGVTANAPQHAFENFHFQVHLGATAGQNPNTVTPTAPSGPCP
jgi:hypothetical protein